MWQTAMFKQTCTNLTTLPKQRVLQWLAGFETVLFDADGVLWHFNKAIDGAADAFNQLQSSGRRNFILSNNSSLSCEELEKKATGMGFEVKNCQVINSSLSIANYLAIKKFQRTAYVIGDVGLSEELDKVNISSFRVKPAKLDKPMHQFCADMKLDPKVGAVIVGRDDAFNVPTIIRACNYLQNDKILFLGTSLDMGFPIANRRMVISAGAMIEAIKTISGRKPLILGKPNPWMVREQVSSGKINPETTLMIGDTLSSDILFAHYNGFQSLLVGSGVNSLQDVEKMRNNGNEQLVPDAYLPHLGHLNEFLS